MFADSCIIYFRVVYDLCDRSYRAASVVAGPGRTTDGACYFAAAKWPLARTPPRMRLAAPPCHRVSPVVTTTVVTETR